MVKRFSVAKTVRFPDKDLAFIETFAGDNFSEKLCNLITSYRDDFSVRQEELCRLEGQIHYRGEQLEQLSKKIDTLDDALRQIFYIEPTFKRIRTEVQEILADLPVPN